MKTKKIIRLLDKTSKMIKQWDDYNELSQLEKELVLSNLRKVYDAVCFLESDAVENKPQKGKKEQAEAPKVEPKAKIEHKVIMSLYEDEPEPEVVTEQEPVIEPEPEVVTPPEPIVEQEPEPEPAPEPFIESTPEKTLSEILSIQTTTLGDTFQQNAVDYASKFSGESLKKMIGINDKFLLLRDLFDGDEAQYEKTILALEQVESLDLALIYLAENYPLWNPNCDGAKFLMDILKRKLS